MKKKLLALLTSKQEARKALMTKADTSQDVAELRSLNTQMDSLNAEIRDLEGMIAGIADEPEEEERTGATSGIPVIASTGAETRKSDPDMEYREAFRNYIATGTVIPPELRTNAQTTTTDASAVIPSTILNEIIKKMEQAGGLYARVRKTNIAGGVTVPILTLKPAATWITEALPSDRQKVEISTNISFNYYGLECKIAQSLIVNTTSLPVFEQTIIQLISEAMFRALDVAILNGTGTGQPMGITKDTRVAAGQKLTVALADFGTWAGWKKNVFAKIPLSYDNGIFIMAKGTFDGYIDGMVDTTGQPIARVTYGIDGKLAYRFGGKEVFLVEDTLIKSFDTATGSATVGDIVVVYVDLNDYIINSNMAMNMLRYTDNDLNQIIDKAILVADGKLADANGVLLIKKGV